MNVPSVAVSPSHREPLYLTSDEATHVPRRSGLDILFGQATHVIRFATLLATIAIWAVVGFVFWVPMIARATLLFTTHTLYANLRHGNASVMNLGLEHAITFYVNGFRNIIDTVANDHVPDRERYSGPAVRIGRLLVETASAGFVWWLTLLSLSQLGWTGRELGEALLVPLQWLSDGARWAWAELQASA